MDDNKNMEFTNPIQYDWVNDFRENIKNFDARYKVCVTDVCFNILYPYCDCITYNGLFTLIPEIAYRYMFGLSTKILLVDYKLVDGKSINTLVDSFISKLYDFIHSRGDSSSLDDVKKEFFRDFFVGFMLQKKTTSFIFSRLYQHNIYCKNLFFEPNAFNERETRVVYMKPNLGCLSFSINSETADIINKEASSLEFNYKIDDGDKSYIYFACDGANVKAASVLQIVRASSGHIYIEPSIILANLDTTNCFELYKKIFSENILKSFEQHIGIPVVANNLLYTVLCYNIICNFHIQQFLDKQKVKANFGNNEFFNMVIDELFTIQKPFLSLDDVAKFTTSTLGCLSKSDSTSDENSDFPVKLQNVIFDIYKQQEKLAYDVLRGKRSSDHANKIHPNSYYDVINVGVNPSSKSEFATTFHELLRLRNFGIINLCFYNKDDYKNNCGVIVDDLAYLIMALRYSTSKYAPFLDYFATTDSLQRIEYYFKMLYTDEIHSTDTKIKNESNEILSYIRFLISTGHLWREYDDIIYPHFETIDDSWRKKYPDQTDDDIILTKIIYQGICAESEREKFKQKVKQKNL